MSRKYYKVCKYVKGKYRSIMLQGELEGARRNVGDKWEQIRSIFKLKGNKSHYDYDWSYLRGFVNELVGMIREMLMYEFMVKTYKLERWTKPNVGKLMVFGNKGEALNFAEGFRGRVFECLVTNPEKANIVANMGFALGMLNYWKKYRKADTYLYNDYITRTIYNDDPRLSFITMSIPKDTYLVSSCMLVEEVLG